MQEQQRKESRGTRQSKKDTWPSSDTDGTETKEQKIGYQTYQTEEEKTLRVTIKRDHSGQPAEDVKLEFEELGLHPGITYRLLPRKLYNKSRKTTTRNIVVNVPKTEKDILNL